MKVGLLTGGGDCPGLNAVIRAVVQQLANEGGTCVGILEGWRGLVQNMTCPALDGPDRRHHRAGWEHPRLLPNQSLPQSRDRSGRAPRELPPPGAGCPGRDRRR